MGENSKRRPGCLKEFTDMKPKSSKNKLRVLEVGSANGSNFKYYPDNCKLTALEYNDNFKNTFLEKVAKYSNIEFEKYITGSIEDMSAIESNSMDVVLATHVLCSVGNVKLALCEIKRVLKKSGKYIFLEHGCYNRNDMSSKIWNLIQNIVNPIWRFFMGGCNLQRSLWIQIKSSGFSNVKINHDYPEPIPGLLRPQIWGFAQK